MVRWLPVVLLLAGSTASAADDPLSDPLGGASGGDDDLWKMLEHMPPHKSGDLAVAVSYSDVTYWRAFTPPWMGFGIHGAYGGHVGQNLGTRLAGALMVSEEGPVPEYFTLAVEPAFDVDHIAHGVLMGASVGPSLLFHSHLDRVHQVWNVGFSPEISARLGWSQPWSSVQRRMFVVLDPKLRWVAGRPNWVVGVAIGSGNGK